MTTIGTGSDSFTISDRNIAAGIFLSVVVLYSALFLLALHVAQPGVTPESFVIGGSGSDGQIYVSLGKTILADHRFALTATSAPEYFRTPGYPAFVALLLFMFKSLLSVAFVQILLAAFSACITYALGARFFSRGVGVAAAVLYALDPTVILKAFNAYTETFFVFVLLCALWFLVSDRISMRRAFIGGLFLGLLMLVRPVALYLSPLFPLWILWSFRKEMKKAAWCAGVCVLGVLLVTVPWMARNEYLSGHFSISSISAYNTLFANVAEFEVYETGRSKAEVWNEMDVRLGTSDGLLLHSYHYQDAEIALIKEDLSGHLPAYVLFHALKTLPFFFSSSIGATELALHAEGVLAGPAPADVNLSAALLSGHIRTIVDALASDPFQTLEEVAWLVVWMLAFLSMFLLGKRVREAAIFLFLLALAFAVLTGPISMPPYRMPVEPFIFALAAASVYTLVHRFRAQAEAERKAAVTQS